MIETSKPHSSALRIRTVWIEERVYGVRLKFKIRGIRSAFPSIVWPITASTWRRCLRQIEWCRWLFFSATAGIDGNWFWAENATVISNAAIWKLPSLVFRTSDTGIALKHRGTPQFAQHALFTDFQSSSLCRGGSRFVRT